jgi:hypothetical protein
MLLSANCMNGTCMSSTDNISRQHAIFLALTEGWRTGRQISPSSTVNKSTLLGSCCF